jgi:hypothetical protein
VTGTVSAIFDTLLDVATDLLTVTDLESDIVTSRSIATGMSTGVEMGPVFVTYSDEYLEVTDSVDTSNDSEDVVPCSTETESEAGTEDDSVAEAGIVDEYVSAVLPTVDDGTTVESAHG